jgi:hypothetical protein
MIRLIIANDPVIINKATALNSMAKPSCVISSGNTGVASHNNRSADINTANATNINNRAILIVKMATGIFNITGRFVTQLLIKKLNT